MEVVIKSVNADPIKNILAWFKRRIEEDFYSHFNLVEQLHRTIHVAPHPGNTPDVYDDFADALDYADIFFEKEFANFLGLAIKYGVIDRETNFVIRSIYVTDHDVKLVAFMNLIARKVNNGNVTFTLKRFDELDHEETML